VRARVGDVWGGLDNAKVFAGHSEMLLVENALASGAVWYFGLGVLTNGIITARTALVFSRFQEIGTPPPAASTQGSTP
jgi:hypothetical protein